MIESSLGLTQLQQKLIFLNIDRMNGSSIPKSIFISLDGLLLFEIRITVDPRKRFDRAFDYQIAIQAV